MKIKKIKIEILNIYNYHFYCKVDNDILQKEKKVKLSSSYQHGFMSNSTTSWISCFIYTESLIYSKQNCTYQVVSSSYMNS